MSGKKQISVYKFYRIAHYYKSTPVRVFFENYKDVLRAIIYRNFIYAEIWEKGRTIYIRYDCNFENHKELFMYYEDHTAVVV
jgi:hypothetical protein